MQFTNTYSQTSETPQGVVLADILPPRVDRRTAFRIWLETSGLTMQKIAACLGMRQSSLSQAIGRERISVRNFKTLVESGVPAQLLPRPEDVKRGRKPRAQRR